MLFRSLASSSAGFAFSIAKSDLSISKSSLMTHLAGVCQVTSLPVSADLQNGFGNDPEDMAVTILQAARTGIAGQAPCRARGPPGRQSAGPAAFARAFAPSPPRRGAADSEIHHAPS